MVVENVNVIYVFDWRSHVIAKCGNVNDKIFVR